MTVWVYRDGKLVDKDTAGPPPGAGAVYGRGPYIQSDIKPYFSVASNKIVGGRRDQREDLKATGCRLAEPCEAPKACRTERWARKLGLPHEPPPPPIKRITRIGPET